MSKRLKQQIVEGPKGEKLKINWMPGNRVRLDFSNCGECVVTKLFPKIKTATNIEIKIMENEM